MHYKLHDPSRTSYRQPFYGYGAEGETVVGTPTVGGSPLPMTAGPDIVQPTVQLGAATTPTFSYLSPLLAFGTSFLAAYVVAGHIGIEKAKTMNLAVTMGLLSGIGQIAAQVLQRWVVKAQTQIDPGLITASNTPSNVHFTSSQNGVKV